MCGGICVWKKWKIVWRNGGYEIRDFRVGVVLDKVERGFDIEMVRRGEMEIGRRERWILRKGIKVSDHCKGYWYYLLLHGGGLVKDYCFYYRANISGRLDYDIFPKLK